MYFRRFTEGLQDFGILIPETDNPLDYVRDPKRDYYLSVYKYNDFQKSMFDQKGSIKKIDDVIADRLWWDFDNEASLASAQQCTLSLVEELMKHGIDHRQMSITFSGKKGFGVGINVDTILLPQEVKSIAFSLADKLSDFDDSMYNASRLWRITGTIHPETGRYKIPLSYSIIKEASVEDILKMAGEPIRPSEKGYSNVELPQSILVLKDRKQQPTIIHDPHVQEIDFKHKVHGWSNCKWALTQGIGVKPGDRHYKHVGIAATAKSLNNTKEQAYHLVKNADQLGTLRYGGDRTNKEEIWKHIESVYGPDWKGGTFSCKDGNSPWLTAICQSLGPHACKREDDKTFCDLTDLSSTFSKFANEIEKNKIATGIISLDQNVTLCTSTLVGLLGNPGSGKTSLALNILRNCSKNNVPAVFFSMDMGIPLVYLKLIQKEFGLQHDKVFELYKYNKEEATKIDAEIRQKYNDVKFCFKTGLDVKKMKDSVFECQERTGKKVRLVGVDYLECIAGPYSDATANTAIIANELKDLANETETCVLLLLQTQKHAAAPDEPLLSMKNIKGSSVIEQASSVVLSIWREGYNPKYSEYDDFISIATVKDRFNGLWKDDFMWEGIRGNISDINAEQRKKLEDLRALKRSHKQEEQKHQAFGQ